MATREDREAAGIFDVSDNGATGNPNDNQTDAVWVTLMRLWHSLRPRATLRFPAGTYRVNLTITAQAHMTGIAIEGAGIDSTLLVMDPSVATQSGTWSLEEGNWVNSLEPSLTGSTISTAHDWDTIQSVVPRNAFVVCSIIGNTACSLYTRNITIKKNTQDFGNPSAGHHGLRNATPGKTIMSNTRLANFYAGCRMDWGPPPPPINLYPLGRYPVPQPRPQKFVARNCKFEDMLGYCANGDGSYTLINPTFLRIGYGTIPAEIGRCIYLKRVNYVLLKGALFNDCFGVALQFDNDHDTGEEPAFSWGGSVIDVLDCDFSDYNGGDPQAADVIVSAINNPVQWNIKGNTFTGSGNMKWYKTGGLTFENNSVTNMGVYVNINVTPASSITPKFINNDFYGCLLNIRSYGLLTQDNLFSSTPRTVVVDSEWVSNNDTIIP